MWYSFLQSTIVYMILLIKFVQQTTENLYYSFPFQICYNSPFDYTTQLFNMTQIIKHFPVMASNVLTKIASLNIKRPLRIADCNFGFGGHSRKILESFSNALVYNQGFDLDPEIIDYFNQHYLVQMDEQMKKRIFISNENFTNIEKVKIFQKFDIILADFGFNSYHLESNRGFTWQRNEILDMRYSPQMRSCKEIVNELSVLELISILQRYGQVKNAKKIAQAIVQNRPINTTEELRNSILKCFQENKTRQIAQIFQAFRIATNNELKDIEALCSSAGRVLEKGGMMIAITFHSLERDVIHQFVKQTKIFSGVEVSQPSALEKEENSRSKSAKMLCFKKIIND